MMIKLVLFTVASAGLVYVSRTSLGAPRSHGFYRFFAWELTLALIFLNLDRWFQDPFSALQIISWLLLISSLFLVVHGAFLLRKMGRPDKKRDEDESLIGIEKTTALVTVGAFKYIRHPLYSSLLFGAWGVFFKDPSWPGGILALGATVFLVITAKVEEAECIRFFGPAYQTYMEQTKMFIPFLL
jgi:protein-S-isoprenylcysteine O-methyltransferase Ste14